MPSLTATDVARLLKDRGWEQDGSSSFGTLWTHPPTGASVGVPGALSEASFEWEGVVKRIAAAERWSEAEATQRLRRLFVDVALLRAVGDTGGESIPIDAAERLVVSGRQLVRSAATTARTPKIVIGSGYSKPGDEIAASARVGYTRSGSYVVPLLMPLTPSEDLPARQGKEPLFDAEVAREPQERRVTRTLAESLVAIQRRIVEPAREPTASDLTALAVAGVSRESVLAVHRSVTGEGLAQLEVRFEWAGAVKAPPTLPLSVGFPSESAPLLRRSASLMRPAARRGHELLTGVIVQFRRGDHLDEFWLQTVRRGRPTEVHVTIQGTRRREVLQWIDSGETVVVAGRVEAVRGKRPRVFRPDSVYPLSETFLFNES